MDNPNDKTPENISDKNYEEKVLKAFDKTDSEPPPILQSQEEKDKILETQKEIKGLPDEFSLKFVGDLGYLLEIFSYKYDQFNSLDFLKKTRDRMLEEGYPDCSALNEFLFWTTMSRRLQIVYQRVHAKLLRQKGIAEDEAENIGMLKEMRNVSEQVSSLQRTLDALLDKKKQVRDVVDLHEEAMKEAEDFIRTHIGEATFSCSKCGSIVNTQGLPHFAIMTDKDDRGEAIYYTFSPELWFLIRKDLIPLHYVAFVLRTSPEGVLVTAEARKEYGSKVMIENSELLEEEEKKLKKLRDEFDRKN